MDKIDKVLYLFYPFCTTFVTIVTFYIYARVRYIYCKSELQA